MQILKEGKLQDYNNDLLINNGKVSFKEGNSISISDNAEYIVPGFIDQHIHGAMGIDTMDHEKLDIFSKTLLKEGTTSFVPTTMTAPIDKVEEVIDYVHSFSKECDGANILGVNVEGPFLDQKYKGAQNGKYIAVPTIEDIDRLNKDNFIRIITMAPEHDENNTIKYMASKGITVSLGHSGASTTVGNKALEDGANCFTHLYNGMSGFNHREPGLVVSALGSDAYVELISDGIHVHPEVLKYTYKTKGYEKCILVTDAVRAKAMENGEYELGGQVIIKGDNDVRLENGSLAGSILTLNNAVKNIIEFTDCTKEEAFKMASLNPALNLGIKNKGILEEGYDFDVTVLDKDFNVLQVFVNGEEKNI
ncbi:MAG: N-acetylglucosamine-6-phosphate deacetylase [Mycoplasmatales bacterium]